MKNIFRKVFHHHELCDKPPVLVDVGASGELHKEWKLIAPYSICVGFDADTRDFVVDEKKESEYKKLYLVNRMVAEVAEKNRDFYLTCSPHCSSSLKPHCEALEPWAFRELFDIEKVLKIESITIEEALKDCNLEYIDWYKTDSQGTDLRIFAALPEELQERILIAEFEPGIIDSYHSEDKLHEIMRYMERLPFWVTNITIKGSQRIDQEDMTLLNFIQKKYVHGFIHTAPGWGEISYFNKLERDCEIRDLLLGWVFSLIKKEYGFSLRLARLGEQHYREPIFTELKNYSLNLISKEYPKFFLFIFQRILKKYIYE